MKKAMALLTLTGLLAALLLAGCGAQPAEEPTPEPEPASEAEPEPEAAPTAEEADPVEIKLAAAASLEDSFVSTLIPLFNETHPEITVVGTYGASGKLQTQIEEGLDADLFMSAATKQMNALDEGGYIDSASMVELLENEIVLIAAADSDAGITSFEEITNADMIAIGDPESVPAGQYAQEALTSLGLYDAVLAKASLGTDVTEVLNWVAEGSADVGIVYATDAAQMPDKVKILATAPEGSLEQKVIYPVAILAEAPHPEAAQLFLDFLQSPEAIDVFVANGFKSNL